MLLTSVGCTKKAPTSEAPPSSEVPAPEAPSVPDAVSTPLCKMAFATVTGAAQGVAEVLACGNVSAIAADLSTPLQSLGLCPEVVQQGFLGDVVCPKVADVVVSMGVTTLPTAWGCTGGKPAEELKAAILEKCKSAL